jgi:DNA-damage-inducible protein D
VKTAKGLKGADNLLDRADHLELSAHEFQMNLAANALVNEGVRGEQAAFNKNLEIAKHVRRTIKESGGTLPEHLPLAPDHIGDVRKRVTGRKSKALPKPKAPTA